MVHSNCYKIKEKEHCLLLTYPVHPAKLCLHYCVNRIFKDLDVVSFIPDLHTIGRTYQVIRDRVPKSKLIVTMYKEQSSERKQEE